MTTTNIELDPQVVEAIARRVAELLGGEEVAGAPELIDAAELARRRGMCELGEGVRNGAPARLASRMSRDQAGEICGRRDFEAMDWRR